MTADQLHASFSAFMERVQAAEQAVQASASFGSDIEMAQGYQHLVRPTTWPSEANHEQHPSAQLVNLSDIADHIGSIDQTAETDRTAERASRRRHLQVRANR